MKMDKNTNKPLKESAAVYVNDQKIGRLSIDPRGQLDLKVSAEYVFPIQEIWHKIKNEGVDHLGDLVLDDPLEVPNELLFSEFWQALSREGIELRQK